MKPAAVLVAVLWALSCSGRDSALPPACSAADLAKITAECSAQVAVACPPGEAPCLVEDQCDARVNAWEASCLKH